VTKEVIHDITKQLFHEVIDEMSKQLSTDAVLRSRTFILQQSECVCNELIGDVVSHLIRSHLLLLSLSIVPYFIISQGPVYYRPAYT